MGIIFSTLYNHVYRSITATKLEHSSCDVIDMVIIAVTSTCHNKVYHALRHTYVHKTQARPETTTSCTHTIMCLGSGTRDGYFFDFYSHCSSTQLCRYLGVCLLPKHPPTAYRHVIPLHQYTQLPHMLMCFFSFSVLCILYSCNSFCAT